MPAYDYACEACGYQFEAIHGVWDKEIDKPKILCDECGGICKIMIRAVHTVHMTEQTLGSLADRKADRLSDDERQHLAAKHETRKVGPGAKLPEGMTREKREKRTPKWWDKHTTKTTKEIKKLTPAETKNYVQKGT